MKKRMSSMTAHEFVQAVGVLSVNYKGMAAKLDRSPQMVSRYALGLSAIPQTTAARVIELVNQRAKEAESIRMSLDTKGEIDQVIGPAQSPAYRGGTRGRFLKRTRKPDLSELPAVELRYRQWLCATKALKAWSAELHKRQRESGEEWELNQLSYELGDLKCIVACWPKGLPYKAALRRVEWQVLSRALRFYAGQEPYARSLYQTWRKRYLGAGGV